MFWLAFFAHRFLIFGGVSVFFTQAKASAKLRSRALWEPSGSFLPIHLMCSWCCHKWQPVDTSGILMPDSWNQCKNFRIKALKTEPQGSPNQAFNKKTMWCHVEAAGEKKIKVSNSKTMLFHAEAVGEGGKKVYLLYLYTVSQTKHLTIPFHPPRLCSLLVDFLRRDHQSLFVVLGLQFLRVWPVLPESMGLPVFTFQEA